MVTTTISITWYFPLVSSSFIFVPILGTVSDWVSEDSECQSIQEYLESRIHLYSPSTLLLLKNWINLIFDDEMEIKLPTSTSTSSTLPPPPAPPQSDSTTAAADANTIEGSHMEVPEKVKF